MAIIASLTLKSKNEQMQLRRKYEVAWFIVVMAVWIAVDAACGWWTALDSVILIVLLVVTMVVTPWRQHTF